MKPVAILSLVALAVLGGVVVGRNVHADCTPWFDWFKVCGAVITKQ